MTNCLVYMIRNLVNDKVYIGQTWGSLQNRWVKHCDPKSGCIAIRNAIQLYGSDKFRIDLLTVSHTQDCADYWERYFIARYDSIRNGYNILQGGCIGKSMAGVPKSKEHRAKLSVAKKGRKRGKPVSEQGRRNLSLSKKGDKNPNYGKPMSDEAKLALSLAIKGRPKSDEWRQTMSIAKSGKKIPSLRRFSDDEADIIRNDIRPSKYIAKDYGCNVKTILHIKNRTGAYK